MSSSKTVPAKTEFSNISRNDFPNDFVFGTATSAYQVEGGAAKGGRGLSVWDDFTSRNPNKITGGANGNVAVDMYTRYEEDIKMMKSMGFDSYRFSISWPRILPRGKRVHGVNPKGINYYNNVINTLLKNGIQPYVTLFHWDLPLPLEQEYKGFLSKNIVDDFRDFVKVCFEEFGDRVKYWTTLNEPWTYCIRGYVECAFPPAKHPKEDGSTSSAAPPIKSGTLRNVDTTVFVDKICDNVRTHGRTKKTGHNFIHYRGFNRVANDLHFLTYSIHDDRTISIPTKEGLVKNKTIQTIIYQQTLRYKSSSIHHVSAECFKDLARDSYTAARNMLLAHAAAVELYRNKFQGHQKGKIGITLVSHWFEPFTNSHNDKKAADRGLDFMLGWFLEPVLTGKYPKSMIDFVPKEYLAPFSEQESKLLKGSIDFLGLNYYTTMYAADDPNPTIHIGYNKDQHMKTYTKKDGKSIGEECGASWLLIVPWGFHKLLKHISDKYNKHAKLPPIYITENGMADKMNNRLTAEQACRDEQRVNYYRDHLGYLLKAIKEGVNIKGYFAWSWCDNFEWVDGYDFRFGIIYIDYRNNLERHPKDSAKWFRKFLLKKSKKK